MIISGSTISTCTGVFAKHFELFSYGRSIKINKEPVVTFASTGSAVLAGYGNTSLETNLTYTPQYRSFPVVVRYNKEQSLQEFAETRLQISQGKVYIKVEKDCRDYIVNGKTLSAELDDKVFNVITDDGVQNYFGLTYYKFYLMATN